jgi:hypothetical protein
MQSDTAARKSEQSIRSGCTHSILLAVWRNVLASAISEAENIGTATAEEKIIAIETIVSSRFIFSNEEER